MKHRKQPVMLTGIVAAGCLSAAAVVHAEQFWIEAPVVDVQPQLRVVQVTVPQQVCWDEPVQHAARDHRRESFTPKILGGILGGVVGNQFGGGRGRTAMTVAGALLGASMGNDAARQRIPAQATYTSFERRCKTEQVTHEEERADGYRVTYEYAGRRFTTRSPVDPGNSIRVRVQVEPVTYNDGYGATQY